MRALLARARTLSPAAVWFPALALIVSGPLLAFSGYLMLLDYPAGPQFPKFSWFPLPSSGDIGNGTPLLAIERLLRWVHVYLPDKVLLLAPILLGGVGIYRFTRRHLEVGSWAAIFGGTLFVVNPFVLDRYLAGHVHFLLGYGLLPWALAPVARAVLEPSIRGAIPLGLWLFVLGIVDLHIMGMYGLLVLVAIGFAKTSILRRIGLGAGTMGLAALLSAYWLLPAIFANLGEGIGAADLEVYATRPRGYGVLPKLLSMYGFWRDEFVGPAERIPALYLLLVPILGLVTLGLMALLARERQRRFTGAVAVSGLVALVLAAGISLPPTAGGFRWLFDRIPLMGVYREPQKFIALVVLAFAVFGAAGLAALAAQASRRARRIHPAALGVAAMIAVLAYSFSMIGGFWGQVSLSRYPKDWALAARTMQSAGRLAVMPWELYAVWTFSDGRITANPAPSFFSRDVLSANEAGFEAVPIQSTDPFSIFMARLLERRGDIRWFGHLIAPLGVRYVAWLAEVDAWEYDFLTRQPDLVPIFRSEQLILFENAAWQEVPVGMESGEPPSSLGSLLGSRQELRAVEGLFVMPPLRQKARTEFPGVARILPIWQEIRPGGSPFLLTGDRCTDGWVLGRSKSRCHLGAVATFQSPALAEILWRPLSGARLLGFVVVGLTLVAIGIYLSAGILRRPVR